MRTPVTGMGWVVAQSEVPMVRSFFVRCNHCYDFS